jgi:hypothetical protein
MKKILLVLLIALTGCSTKTVPVTVKFPTAPDRLTTTCRDLKEVPESTDKLSVLSDIVIDNYSQYHYCKTLVDGWNEWYTTQKKIFEEVK